MTIPKKAESHKQNQKGLRLTFWAILFFTAVLAGQIVPAFFR